MYYICRKFKSYIKYIAMITIRNKATGETYRYSGANKEFATKDSFITNERRGMRFRSNWHAVIDYFIDMPHSTQCLLKDQFEVVL